MMSAGATTSVAVHGAHEADTPPPYSEAGQYSGSLATQYHHRMSDAPPSYVNSTTSSPTASHPRQSIAHLFRSSFSLYRESSSSNRILHIGEHKNTPLFAVSLHAGNPFLVLHNGPKVSLPPLATVNYDSAGTYINLSLPSLACTYAHSINERIDVSSGFHTMYHFGVEVDVHTGRREEFEWRQSRGRAIQKLDGRAQGWKLVRLRGAGKMETVMRYGRMDAGAEVVQRPGEYTTSDGKEVVAVWSNALFSHSKMIRFKFTESGSSGVLGERWAVMAVATMLMIWEIERRTKYGQAGVGG